VRATVRINAIHLADDTVTFTDASDEQTSVHVKDAEMRKLLTTLKPGDIVEIVYTEAAAISVSARQLISGINHDGRALHP
jgi:translation elongation factor P/translation initiation factor 5A